LEPYLLSEISALLVCVLVRYCQSQHSMKVSPSRCVQFEVAFLFLGVAFSVSHHDALLCIVSLDHLISREKNVRSVILVLAWGQDYDP
jgi:hypothetical protein